MWFGPPEPAIPVLEAPQPAGPSVHKATWPRATLGGKAAGFATDIRALYVTGNNYLNQGSDVAKNVKAFESLDLVVCHDIFLTPTARYADIVLPATHSLEREDVVVPEDNYLYYSAKIFDPIGEARNDVDIFADLSRRLGLGDLFDEGLSKERWVDRIIDNSSITEDDRAEFKATGIYDGGEHERYGLTPFITDPTKNPLGTPSGKIEISSELYAETGFPAWPVYRPLPYNESLPLMLVTPHSCFRINSTGSNISWVHERDPVRLWINPSDAEDRGISAGDMVRVQSATGHMEVAALLTDDVMRGVVSCDEGKWFGSDGDGSLNRLTPLDPTLPSVGTRTHTMFVEVNREGHA